MAALRGKHPYLISHIILNPFQYRDITGSRSLIVANQRFSVVGVRSDNANGLIFLLVKGQQVILIL